MTRLVTRPIREPRDHACVRRSGDRADDDRVEEHAELALLRLDLARPRGKPEAAEGMVETLPRESRGLPATRHNICECLLPALLEPI